MTPSEKLAPDVFDLPANVLPVAIVGHTISTIGVNIEAQKIETIKVDIVAQTIDKIAIDIAAQTLSQVDVNIAAQAVTVNVKTPAGEHVDADIVSSITLDINLTGSTITLPVNIAAQAITLAVDITAQTISTLNIDIAAQTLSDIDIDIVRQSDAVEDRKEFQEGITDLLISGRDPSVPGRTTRAIVEIVVPSGYKYRVYDLVLSGTKAGMWFLTSDDVVIAYLGHNPAGGSLTISGTMAIVLAEGTWKIKVENLATQSGDFIVHGRGWT